MNVILFERDRHQFYPLSYTRPIALFRIGIFTIEQKWKNYFKDVSLSTTNYLSDQFNPIVKDDNLWIDSSVLPNPDLVTEINSLRFGEALRQQDRIIAFRNCEYDDKVLVNVETNVNFKRLRSCTDIFSFNGDEIISDINFFDLNILKKNRVSSTNNIIGSNYPLVVEEGVKVEYVNLNLNSGPIYLGKDVEIMEGSSIKGPFAACECSLVKLNSKIYESTTLGPYTKVGGEVSNSVFFGFSAKSHDGYIGNSVIGEWCNLGAGTNISNLKNNYANVKIWNYKIERFLDTGLQFCGLLMGDHSKTGINTMFNTGTVVGVSANIFGSGYPRNFIPSFSWGGASGFSNYSLIKALEVAKKVMSRRGVNLSDHDIKILEVVYDISSKFRNY
ncbi:MAG: glucose-1-phosphate thymidylyltransferase [Flavobacteriales bacterium]|nr:glucose-1-phosphate thymidylyltransferase [Flavobacteriales bacterium]|tara:strand:- start:232 stop:1395 length:1164 start_codon:yes stop_codon:yes gene_type:complete